MTPEEQSELRKMDALIHEKVMGAKWYRGNVGRRCYLMLPEEVDGDPVENPVEAQRSFAGLPYYTTSIQVAWKIMEKFKDQGWAVVWTALMDKGEGWFVVDHREYQTYSLSGNAQPTAPLAICHAVLKVLENKA